MTVSTKSPCATPARVSDADVIFVLAGLEARKIFALQLWRRQSVPRILFSVGRFEIRGFSRLALPAPFNLLEIAAPVPPPQRHFFVSFEGRKACFQRIPTGRFGTWSEIEALADWLRGRQEVRSVTVVSSAYHLYRVRTSCRALLPVQLWVDYLASPADGPGRKERLWSLSLRHLRLLLAEGVKIPCYWFLSWLVGRGRRAGNQPMR